MGPSALEYIGGLILIFIVFFGLFRAAPAAYGSSQGRYHIGAAAAGLCHSPHNAGSELCNHITARSNPGSITRCAGPGIEPESSWMLVGFVTAEPQQELLLSYS